MGYIGEGGDHCAGGAVTIPVAVPGALLAANGCVAHRPLPLAQVALSAAGGAPFAPPLLEAAGRHQHQNLAHN